MLVNVMPAREDALCLPPFICDDFDSAGAPYFDSHLNAWVLSAHAEVAAAFHESRLAPGGGDEEASGETPQSKMRAEVREALSPERLQSWRASLSTDVDSLLGR